VVVALFVIGVVKLTIVAIVESCGLLKAGHATLAPQARPPYTRDGMAAAAPAGGGPAAEAQGVIRTYCESAEASIGSDG
jgi:hypothetical protein